MSDVVASGQAATPGPKSEGQALLDRMLAQCNRYNALRKRLVEIRGTIAPPMPQRPTVDPGTPPAPAKSFFDGLKMLADGNDLVADELEATISELAALF